ncbi:unnamed protein product [Heligmosomoides polygyrus]|uniref:EGF-like domain-containing protein n=1 Tax=Heligmosomoides polygyrus TaxID=6339 RepID=A0A3P8CGB2_HELPZ|nr:unnamed protein product [Heligmosomoides polygyrus]
MCVDEEVQEEISSTTHVRRQNSRRLSENIGERCTSNLDHSPLIEYTPLKRTFAFIARNARDNDTDKSTVDNLIVYPNNLLDYLVSYLSKNPGYYTSFLANIFSAENAKAIYFIMVETYSEFPDGTYKEFSSLAARTGGASFRLSDYDAVRKFLDVYFNEIIGGDLVSYKPYYHLNADGLYVETYSFSAQSDLEYAMLTVNPDGSSKVVSADVFSHDNDISIPLCSPQTIGRDLTFFSFQCASFSVETFQARVYFSSSDETTTSGSVFIFEKNSTSTTSIAFSPTVYGNAISGTPCVTMPNNTCSCDSEKYDGDFCQISLENCNSSPDAPYIANEVSSLILVAERLSTPLNLITSADTLKALLGIQIVVVYLVLLSRGGDFPVSSALVNELSNRRAELRVFSGKDTLNSTTLAALGNGIPFVIGNRREFEQDYFPNYVVPAASKATLLSSPTLNVIASDNMCNVALTIPAESFSSKLTMFIHTRNSDSSLVDVAVSQGGNVIMNSAKIGQITQKFIISSDVDTSVNIGGSDRCSYSIEMLNYYKIGYTFQSDNLAENGYQGPSDDTCSGNGQQVRGICVCNGGWDGPDCSLPKCVNGGSRLETVCGCPPRYTGVFCEEEMFRNIAFIVDSIGLDDTAFNSSITSMIEFVGLYDMQELRILLIDNADALSLNQNFVTYTTESFSASLNAIFPNRNRANEPKLDE